MTDDIISRQAAIDAVNAYFSISEINRTVQNMTSVQDIIKRLPSAQPGIIRCKDCKYFEYNKTYVVQGIPVLGHEVCNAWGDGCKTDENGYCFLAKRRADKLHDD